MISAIIYHDLTVAPSRCEFIGRVIRNRYKAAWKYVPSPSGIFASVSLDGFRSRLGLESNRSRSQAYYLDTLNTPDIWLGKASEILLVFCLLYLQMRIKRNRQKNTRSSKNLQLGFGDNIFLINFRKIIGKSDTFQVSTLDFLIKSQFRRFNQVLVSDVTVLLHH